MNRDQFLKQTNGGRDFYQLIIPELKYNNDNSFKGIISPFRNEKRPSFSIYKNEDNDRWLFYDHGDSNYTGDVFTFAAFHYGLDVKTQFREILKRMTADLGLEDGNSSFSQSDEIASIDFLIKFFKPFGVGKYLIQEYNVTQEIHTNCVSGETISHVIYNLPNCRKYYVPEPEKKFWYKGSKPKDFVFGLREIIKRNEKGIKREVLVFTGGEKDVLTLSALGFDAISLNSETSMNIPESVKDIFKNYRRRVILYDVDETGLRSSKKLAGMFPEIDRVILPRKSNLIHIKDISDYVKAGQDINVIHELLQGSSKQKEPHIEANDLEEDNLLDEEEIDDETLFDELLHTPIIDDFVYKHLPEPLNGMCQFFKDGRPKDVVLLSTLVSVSSFLPYVYGSYGNKTIGPNLFGFIIAPAASGKGDAKWSRKLAAKIEKQLSKDHNLALKEYKSKLKDNPDLVEPIPRKLCLPGNSSSASIIKTLNANTTVNNRNFGLIHETEADTLANASKQDWSDFTDALRRSFEHEHISSGRLSGITEIEFPQLSVFLSGTPNQVKNLINNVENGFFSRIMFYTFRTKNEWVDPFSNSSIDLDFQYDLYSELFLIYWNLQFDNNYEILIKLTEQQRATFNNYFTNKVNEFEKFGQEIIANLYRMGVIHYRICMVLTILREFDNTDTPDEKLFVSDVDFEIATKIVDCLLDHLVVVYNGLSSKPIKAGIKFTVEQKNFFNKLPMQFTKQQYEEIGEQVSISPNGAYKMVSKFISCGLIKQTRRANYEKLETKI